VTSLDVIHSFWAYQLGVKADANPGVDNIAYVQTKKPLTFNIHCAELCGVWHGYMFDTARVVPASQFASWISQQQRRFVPATKLLPPYAKSYIPDPQTEVDELVAVSTPQRPAWQRLIGFNLLSAIVLAIVGWLIGGWIGHHIHAPSLAYFDDTGENDISVFLGYLLGVTGFMIGMGFANYPIRRMLGHPPTLAEHESEGGGGRPLLPAVHRPQGRRPPVRRRDRGVLLHRRAQCDVHPHRAAESQQSRVRAQPVPDAGRPARNDDDGDDDLGHPRSVQPNWLVPLMIGCRRMAFPRIEAFTFWLLMAAGVVLLTTLFLGGFQTGWTGYQPLGGEGTTGYDAYIGFFALVGLSMCLLGLNLLATIHHYARAGHDLVAPADLRLVGAGDRHADAARLADAARGAADGGVRSHGPDRLLRTGAGRQLLPVAEPVLGVRASRGVRRRAAGFGIVLELLPDVLAQAAVGAIGWRSPECSG